MKFILWALIVVAAVSTWLVVRARAQTAPTNSPSDKRAKPEIYGDLRSQALKSSRAAFGLDNTSKPTEPWGVLMEIGFPEGSATILAMSDGSASIYLSSGGGSIGGVGHESIRNAAKAMVVLAGKFQSKMNLTTVFPLPKPTQTVFYLLTDAGVFTASANEDDLGEKRHELSDLFYAGQEIITQYRIVEERGKKNGVSTPQSKPGQ